ncbi:MAG: hypothetical protein WC533_04245 [Candidatus Pacearchaeota archaeon]
MALDFSWLSYYIAIASFLFVFIIVYAVLKKTEVLGKNEWFNVLTSLIMAIVFITFSPGVNYVATILPWFAILIVVLFLLLVVIGFSQKDISSFMKPWFAWVFIILLVIIFVISAIVVFNPIIRPYLPGQTGIEDPFVLSVKEFAYSDRFVGGALLLVVAIAASWVLVKKSK